jgi:hypothetical protein
VAAAACGLGLNGTATQVADAGEPVADVADASFTSPDASNAFDAPARAAAVSDAAEASVDVVDARPLPVPVVARLDIDGPAYAGLDFPGDWAGSLVPGACGPNHYENAGPVSGTRDGTLFEGEAFGNPAICTIGTGLAVGTYRVRLYLAEIYFGSGCPGGGGVGSRVFDVVIEGQTLLRSFDIYAESGGCVRSSTSDAAAPIVKSFDVFVADGTINISLPASADNGKVAAIEVLGPL